MTALFDLAGSYALHPGERASITGQRPVLGPGLLSRVVRGRGTHHVEQTLGQLFSLCSHAHRRTARLAMQAAQHPAHRMRPEPPAQFLVDCHPLASTLQTDFRPLDLLDHDPQKQTGQLHQVAHTIAGQTAFAQRPSWQGQCAETGAWTCDTPAAGLSSGALAMGQGQTLGWCEMARGLLLHWVQLDAQGRVQAYQVVAPTEWNFHPDGALAKALTQLAPQDTAGASLLGKAFDACVECQVSPVASAEPFNA